MLRWLWNLRLLLVVALAMLPAVAAADLLSSTHFRLDPNVADTFGGNSGSSSFKLSDAGGETVVGAGSSQNYHLGQGYVRELPQSIELSVMPSGTYAYWPFDTGSGPTAYDVGAQSDDATLVGSPAWTTGMVGGAVQLNGTTQYVTTAKQVSSPSPFTIEFWFNSSSSSGGELMGFSDAATGAGAGPDRLVYLRDDGKLTFGVHPAGGFKTITSQASYNLGGWHHVAASLGASGLRLYVDGQIVGRDASTTTAGNYSGYWRLGYDNMAGWPTAPTSNFAAATLDEARVASRQLTDAEVTGDYTAGANALQNAFTLPHVTPGQSQTYSVDAVVRTDAGGYDLYVARPKPLTHTDGSTTIPDIAGTIASPIVWSEGTTKGLGFTLTSFYGADTNWGSSPNNKYAALPSAATVYHTRTGVTSGVVETTTLQYRADTAPEQKQGTYSTQVIYTATLKP
jgi:hypothetical protein